MAVEYAPKKYTWLLSRALLARRIGTLFVAYFITTGVLCITNFVPFYARVGLARYRDLFPVTAAVESREC